MSVIKDITRWIAPYAVLAGIGVIAWLNRDKIIGWFRSAIAEPVVSAAQSVTAPAAAVFGAPVVSAPPGMPVESGLDVGDILGSLAPGTGLLTIAQNIKNAVFGLEVLGSGNGESSEPVIAPTTPVAVPTEADILWQAKLAEVGPVPSGPAPSGYMVRGSSITGAPLYAPVQEMIGRISIPDAPGTVGEVWQLGPSRLVKIGDVWLGENISACYLSGGWWDAPRGRCVYA